MVILPLNQTRSEMLDHGTRLISLAKIAGDNRLPIPVMRHVIQELGITPALTIDEVARFTEADATRICDAARLKLSRGPAGLGGSGLAGRQNIH